MSAKLQRWVDLVAALVGRHSALTLEELRDHVPAYGKQKTKVALRRMFERDKDDLRALGIPIETHQFEESTGYRIRAADFYLPYLATVVDGRIKTPKRVDREGYKALTTLAFEPDEIEVLGRAIAQVGSVGQPELTADAERARRKLGIDIPFFGAEQDVVALGGRTRGDDAFPSLMEALSHRRKVAFDYYAIGGDSHSQRTVRPFGLFLLNGHWYLAGVEDHDPDGPVKNFRLSRVDDVVVSGSSKTKPQYEIPKRFVLADHARDRKPWELGDAEAIAVIVAFDGSDGATKAAATLGTPVPRRPTHRRFAVRRVDAFVRWLLSFAGEAHPVAPDHVVAEWKAERDAVAALYAEGAR